MFTKYYTHEGLRVIEFPILNFKLQYWDKPKMAAKYPNCFNAGFFAYYSEQGKPFTMPVANLCAGDGGNVPPLGRKYINEWTHNQGLNGDMVKLSAYQNGAPDFSKKEISTLIVYNNGIAKIEDKNVLPPNIRYAVSGVPCIRGGEDVSWSKYVAKQGWGSGVMYATYRNWIGIGGGRMFLISGRTCSGNYIYGMEFYNKVKDLGIEDCIGLDGGGSYFLRLNGKSIAQTAGNRSVNNIGIIL